jgi:hypothetical protein
LDGAES